MDKEDIFEEIIAIGVKHGKITYDEINDAFPAEYFPPDELEELLNLLHDMGVEVLDEQANDISEEEEDHEKTEDIVQAYFHSLGNISVLKRNEEVELAKSLEEGKEIIKGIVTTLPVYRKNEASSDSKMKESLNNEEEDRALESLEMSLKELEKSMINIKVADKKVAHYGALKGLKKLIREKKKKNINPVQLTAIAKEVQNEYKRVESANLLHSALRSVLGDHLKQAGSLVSPDKLRFDFTHFSALEEKEIQSVETLINEKVLEDLPVVTTTMDIKEAIEAGAIALFGEKYGKTVRVVKVPNFTSELCGGTHCKATGEIGLFVILSENSVASGIRRIEALTGSTAFLFLKHMKSEIESINSILKTDAPVERIEKLIKNIRSLEREIQKLKTGSRDVISEALKEVKELGGVKVLKIRHDGLNQEELRNLADNIKDRLQSGIIVVSSVSDDKAAIVCMVTKDLRDKYHAGDIIKKISKIAGGSGGGKPDMAQGGTKEIENLDKALETVYEMVNN